MQLKVSKYVVEEGITDAQSKRPLVVLFSSRTEKLVVIGQDIWNRIKEGDYSAAEPHILSDLQEKSFLVPKDQNELDVVLSEFRDITHTTSTERFYMAVQPTAACPLGCGYCGQVHSPKGLSQESQDNIVNNINTRVSQGKFTHLTVHWFGAEPLSGFSVMSALTPRIKEVAKNHGLICGFGLTTNGLLLNKDIAEALVGDLSVFNIEITLDGIAEFHDQRRHLKTGGETFDKIYSNLKYLLDIKPDNVMVSIRSNTDRRNKEGITPLIHKLAEDDVLHKLEYFYAAPIHSWGNDAHTLAMEQQEFAEWEIDWLTEMEALGVPVKYLPSRKKSFCMATTPGYQIVDPKGDIYKCVELPLVPSYENDGAHSHRLGNIGDAEEFNPKDNVFGNFFDKSSLAKYDCHECNMLPVCGGACPKEWVEGRKACPPTKFNIKERMLLHLAQSLRTEDKRKAA